MGDILNLISSNLGLIKIFLISMCTIYTVKRMINQNNKIKMIYKLSIAVLTIIVSYMYCKIKNGKDILYNANVYSLALLIISLSILCSFIYKKDIIYSMFITIISFGLNYIVFFCSVLFTVIINSILFSVNGEIIEFMILLSIYILTITSILRVRKIKYGIAFLQNKIEDEYLSLIIFNLSITIILLGILFISYNGEYAANFVLAFIIFSIMMFITIQKSLQLYYKQKLLVQELKNTKKELAEKTKEIENLEAENIAISKKAHTLDHKQKSLAKKIDEMMMNTEISKKEVAELKGRLNKIGQDLYKEKTTVELSKTEILEIDDMLTYMQSECIANKIDFELQIKGNIYYMTNNLITIEDLETLLADHIKNAIIAINHTDNVNRSILVRLGEIDGIYSLYIYDSGIEFAKETLENLGKKPSTTHAEEGGTGMGFMNTFDTLRKCKASLTIEELNEPIKDNYTKAIIIKFDNKNEFKVKSFR